MRKLIILFSFLAIASSCILEKYKETEVRVGDLIPGFKVTMNDSSIITDDSLKGSVSVIMFFHPSCPDCQQALPVMQRIYDEYSVTGVRFALISRECGEDEIEAYWSDNGLGMPYSAQNDRVIYNLFASSLIPRIYISDENGIVRYIFTDDPVATYDDLKSAVESLIH